MPLDAAASFRHQAPATLAGFVRLCGEAEWSRRRAQLACLTKDNSLQSRAAQARHGVELALARLAETSPGTEAERRVHALAEEAVALAQALPAPHRRNLRAKLLANLSGDGTLIPTFHLLRTAAELRRRGYDVRFTGLTEDTPFDLLACRDGVEAEIVCDSVSAEEGRHVSRGDWFALVDAINPELRTWLAAHPGRYLLKVTLPEGLAGPDQTALLHHRISALLAEEKRQDSCAQAVLKLDPLVLAGAQAAGALPRRLREAFGPEAHLAVTTNAGGVFALAARAGRENEIAEAVARHGAAAAQEKLTGSRPGILAMFIDDLERGEWRALRDSMALEGVVRRFLTAPTARPVVAVSCTTRFEMLGAAEPDAVPGGELRFRNPAHPAASSPALLAAVQSSN